LTDNDPEKQIFPEHGADDSVDRVCNVSLSHDGYATLDFNRFSGQPTGQSSDYDPKYEIHEASLRS